MPTLNEYIKLRTEQTRELTHLELDNNFLYVANPWKPGRSYKEGMIVYHSDSSTGGLSWFRANQNIAGSNIFDPSKWDPIGANSLSGSIVLKNSDGVINTTSTVEFTADFTVTFSGSTATIQLNPGAVGFWSPSQFNTNTIYYEDRVLIGTDASANPSHKLTVAGNQLISGDLSVSGLINGINIIAFFNDYSAHNHTIVPATLTNYNSLYPVSNGPLADVNVDPLTLANDDVLAWDNTIKRWINKTLTTGPHSLGLHTDVANTVSTGSLNNQILRYDSTTSKWENISIVTNSDTGFTTAPFSHEHDTRYWTKNQLSSVTGPIINWANIFGAPATGAPVDASYVLLSSNSSLTDERILTAGTGITINDGGPNSPVTISVTPKTTNQRVEVSLDNTSIGTRSRINFITPVSGNITYTLTDDAINDVVNILLDVSVTSAVISVNSFTGAVSLGISELDDVATIASNFPGPGTGSPFSPLSNILVYDDDISKWVNVPASSLLSAISGIYLDDILDVDINTGLADKNLIYFDSLSGLWINGSANDAGLYTASQLDAGQLNILYYTKSELNTSGAGGLVHWDNITSVPSFAPASHSHYLHQLIDVSDYSSSLPNNGDILVWDSLLQLWVPQANSGGSGFSTVINNSTATGTYTNTTDQIINPSNTIPLKFQSDLGIKLETDTTENIIKIGVDVDGTTIGFNSAGELEVITPPSSVQIISPDDKFMVALSTSGDGQLATNDTISHTPVDGSYVAVFYNGQELEVGNGVKTKSFYFSNDGGLTAKGFSSSHPNGRIEQNDQLYFNGNIAGFNLQAGSRISLIYMINI